MSVEQLTLSVFNNNYFKLNTTLQIQGGLWPYQHGVGRIIRRAIMYGYATIAFIPFIYAIKKWKGVDLDICIENVLAMIYVSTLVLKYYVTCASEKNLKVIYHRIAKNWIEITDPEEHTILKKHAEQGRLISIAYIGYMIMAGFCFCHVPMISVFLDFIHPLNESRPKKMFIKSEYPFDPYKHFFKLYVFMMVGGFITLIPSVGIDTMYTVIIQQILGIFSIIKYRIYIAVLNFNPVKDIAYDNIIKGITLHIDMLDLIDVIEKSYSHFFLMVMILTIMFLSVSVALLLGHLDETFDVLRLTMVIVGVIIHLVYFSLPGQAVINYSNDLFMSLYATEWYTLSKRSKTLLKIIMLRCKKPCYFTAGGLYVMNLENFGHLMKTSLSYIAVVTSYR